MRFLSAPFLYFIVITVTIAGIVSGLFRPNDFNPWGLPILALGILLLVWSVGSYRFGKVALFSGWFAILAACMGFIGLISVAAVWGFLALILAAIAKKEITFGA